MSNKWHPRIENMYAVYNKMAEISLDGTTVMDEKMVHLTCSTLSVDVEPSEKQI